MKILKLDLLAFGPFTGVILDFGDIGPDFHIVYGPNEAGKSSALRALHQFLYGIPLRSSDAFIHPYGKMRIGGALRLKNGARLELIRKKGAVNTLRNPNDKDIVDDSELGAFLGGIDENFFSTMFGIDHERLVLGGKEIVQGGGEVGQILFSAGSGISDFRKVQEQIKSEADALFLPSGKKPSINAALIELRKLKKAIREAQLPGEIWETHHDALRRAEKDLEKINKELTEKKAALNRLERMKNALSDMSLRKDLLDQQKLLEGAVVLPPDFREKRSKLFQRQALAKADENNARKHLGGIEKSLKELKPLPDILEFSDAVEELYQDLGACRKNKKDRQKFTLKRESLLAESKQLLASFRKDLSLKNAQKAIPDRKETAKIKDLIAKHERLAERKENLWDANRKLNLTVEKCKRELKDANPWKDTQQLNLVIKRSRKAGDLENQLKKASEEIRNRENEIEGVMKRLGFESTSLQKLQSIQIPSGAFIDEHDRLTTEIGNQIKQRRDQEDEASRLIASAQKEILQLNAREIPSIAELKNARALRDQGWQLIRLAWKKNKYREKEAQEFIDAFEPVETLDLAFESSIRRTDDIADRLRHEADRAARKESLTAEVKTQKNRLKHLRLRIAAQNEELDQLQKKWRSAWSKIGIEAESPVQMRSWAAKAETLVVKSGEILARKDEKEHIKNKIRTLKDELSAVLSKLGEKPASDKEPLEQLLERCENFHEEMAARKSKEEGLIKDLDQRMLEREESESRLKECENLLTEWRALWAETVVPLGLGPQSSVAEANAALDASRALCKKLDEIKRLEELISALDKHEESFLIQLNRITEKCAPELSDETMEEAAAALNNLLKEARKLQTRRESVIAEEKKLKKRLEEASREKQTVSAKLEAMCREAEVDSPEELSGALERSSRLMQIRGDLEAAEGRLRELAGGEILEDFLVEAESVDPDRIEGKIQILSEAVADLEKEKGELHEIIGTERNELARMDGSAKAAELSEKYQSVLASLQREAEKYIRLKTGLEILAHAIENYREKHQGPILERSSEFFSRMTLGSFSGLRVEPGKKGESMLAAVRGNTGELVSVDAMSDGSADQLFLAIRLASLESFVKKSEPMPLIVDDILVNFDDDRAAVALDILSELSEASQVIFLTHHMHLVEIAKKRLSQNKLQIHFLA